MADDDDLGDAEMEAIHSCNCCLERPPDKGLNTLYKHLGKAEIYTDMLRECFDIHLSSESNDGGICESCVSRLRDASNFKLQVQRSQAKLQQIRGSGSTQDNNSSKINVKLEKASGADAVTNEIKMEKTDVEMGDGEVVTVAIYGKPSAPSKPTSPSPEPAPPPLENNTIRSCDICQKSFRDQSALKIHRRIHTGEKPYSCKVCNKSFAQKSNLNAHFKYHMGDFRFRCDVCSKGFAHKSAFDKHTVSHSGEKPFECEICKKRFALKGNFTAHLKTHLRRGYNRVQTGDKSTNKKEFNETCDLNTLNEQVQSEEKSYSCDICKKEFVLKGTLRKHLKLKHGPDAGKTYSCEMCNKDFKLKATMECHMQTHTGEIQQNYCCEVCGKQFSQKSYLSVHMKNIHLGKKPYSCEICGKAFAYKNSLEAHTATHSAEKLYSCEICQKRFRQSNTLHGHMMIHKGLKPFTCDVCGQQFRHKFALTVHARRLHTKQRPHTCDICNKSFSVVAELKQHYRVHTGEKPYVCDICQTRFARPQAIRKHLIHVHHEKPSKFYVVKS